MGEAVPDHDLTDAMKGTAVPDSDMPGGVVPDSDIGGGKRATEFPQDEPGYHYGNLLPFRVKQDEKGQDVGLTEWAAPEFVRSIARGLGGINQRVPGGTVASIGETDDPTPHTMRGFNPDEWSAFLSMAGAMGGIRSATPLPKLLLDEGGPSPTGPMASKPWTPEQATAAAEDLSGTSGSLARATPARKAQDIVQKRAAQDVASGAVTAQDVIQNIGRAREAGKPFSPVDVLGANVKGEAGRVARAPGISKNTMEAFYSGRNLESVDRLTGDINNVFGSEPNLQLFEGLKQARSLNAKPLYEKALQGGSIAPLERQFERSFVDIGSIESKASADLAASQSRLNAALAKQMQTGGNVYSTSAGNAEVRNAQADVVATERALASVQADKAKVADVMRRAQDDRTANAPGAVWNLRIQQFLDNPRVQQGIRRGLRIERDEALAEGRPMNPTDYAIVGTDAEGEPIVGSVPTMRLLAVAKEGLDSMLFGKEFRNEFGDLDKEGVAIDRLNHSFVGELDNLNPDYAPARASWSGDTDSLKALQFGQKALRGNPEQNSAAMSQMSENDQEFARLGLAQTLREMANSKGPLAAEFDRLAGSKYGATSTRDKLRPFFRSEEEMNSLVNAVADEIRMARVGNEVLAGSQTASRVAEDTRGMTGEDLAHAGISATLGHPVGAVHRLVNAITRHAFQPSPEVNAEISRLLGSAETELTVDPTGKLILRRPVQGLMPPPIIPGATP